MPSNWAERLDEDTRALPRLSKPLIFEGAKSLASGECGDAVLRSECVFAWQSIAGTVLPRLDGCFQIVRNSPVLGQLVARLSRHVSPYLASDPKAASYRDRRRDGLIHAGATQGAYIVNELLDIANEPRFTESINLVNEVDETSSRDRLTLPGRHRDAFRALPFREEHHLMNVTRRPAASLTTEHFDTETQELLDAIDVELPDFGDIDMDIAFGTPLEMYEPWATPRETAALNADVADVTEFFARRHAAQDILAAGSSITERVRERLVDVLLPYATQLRITQPAAAAPLPLAA